MNNIPYERRLVLLKAFAEVMVNEEWGSTAQIAASNAFYQASSGWYGVDWDEHSYLLKATDEEAVEYVFSIIEPLHAIGNQS